MPLDTSRLRPRVRVLLPRPWPRPGEAGLGAETGAVPEPCTGAGLLALTQEGHEWRQARHWAETHLERARQARLHREGTRVALGQILSWPNTEARWSRARDWARAGNTWLELARAQQLLGCDGDLSREGTWWRAQHRGPDAIHDQLLHLMELQHAWTGPFRHLRAQVPLQNQVRAWWGPDSYLRWTGAHAPKLDRPRELGLAIFNYQGRHRAYVCEMLDKGVDKSGMRELVRACRELEARLRATGHADEPWPVVGGEAGEGLDGMGNDD